MNENFQPNQLPSNQWKTWLRDGGTLLWRSMSTWGVLWIAFCVVLGVGIKAWPILFVIVVACSGVFQLFHQVVMGQVMNGQNELGHLMGALMVFSHERRQLLVQSILIRAIVVVVILSCAAGFILLDKSSPVGKTPHAVQSTWNMWMAVLAPLYSGLVLPLLGQIGGNISTVLGLRREGVPLNMAWRLDLRAFQLNIASTLPLSLGFLLFSIAGAIFTPIIPILVLYWMGVTECYYRDVFGGGYKIKSRAKESVHSLQTATIPV